MGRYFSLFCLCAATTWTQSRAQSCSEDALVADGYSATCCADLGNVTCAEGYGGCSDDAQCTGDLVCGAAGESCSAEIGTAAGENATSARCCGIQVSQVDCETVGTNYYINEPDAERTVCPSGLPGFWTTCPTDCAQNMQTALNDLAVGDEECCAFRWYINGYAGPTSDHGMYSDNAVDHVLELCELDTANTCYDTSEVIDTEACFDVARDFFASSDDLIEGPDVDPNPCPSGLPGVWEECPAACADGMQAAIDELDCCVREYINEFAGPGVDHGSYTDRGFDNVMRICNVELTESACFDPFASQGSVGENSAARLDSVLFVSAGSLLSALALWFL